MINIEDIMLFEEWKESEDYLIQSWFLARKKEVTEWFKKEELKGFTLGDFNWSQNGNYLIYTGFMEFSEEIMDYKLDIVVEFDKIVNGEVSTFNLVLSGYSVENPVLVGKTTEEIESAAFTIDWLIGAIAKFKELFPEEAQPEGSIIKDEEDNNDPNSEIWDI